jgi:ribonuclease D
LPQVTLINTQAEWDRAAARLAQEPELALDTESNSLYTYRESICLIQIAAGEQVFLLDPLAVPDLSALGRILADSTVVKVLHGSDYDI